jgi:hypothetical protein
MNTNSCTIDIKDLLLKIIDRGKMKKTGSMLGVFSLAVLILSGGMAGCAGSDRLAARFEPGMFYAQKITLVSDMKMLFPGADHQESELVLNYRVKEVDEQGRAALKVTVRTLKARMSSLGVTCSYDSEKSAHSSSQEEPKSKKAQNNQKKYENSCIGIAGKSYHALVDKDGRVLEITDVDEQISKLWKKPVQNGSFGGYQLGLLFSPHNLREYINLSLLAARENKKPVVEEKWISFEVAESPRTLPVVFVKKCEIKSIEKQQDDKVAVISFVGEGAKGKELPDYAQLKDKKFQEEMEIVKVEHSSGEATFSLAEGRMLKLEEKLITEVRIPREKLNRNYKEPTDKQRKTYYVMKKTIEYLGK